MIHACSEHVIARSGTTKQSQFWLIGDCFGLRPRDDDIPPFSPSQTDITFGNPYRIVTLFLILQ